MVASALDREIVELVRPLGLTGDPAARRDARQTPPDQDPLVKLGQLLFFSQTLSAQYDVACGTCHHADLAGSDGLSMSVGVSPRVAAAVGPGREVLLSADTDPAADGGPNVHRNSITTFNAALFDRSLMHDGRVFVIDDAVVSGGQGQRIKTPESGNTVVDAQPLSGLLEFAVKVPLASDNSMRGFVYGEYATPTQYREHLVKRLRGEVETHNNPKPDGPANWLQRFRAAFDRPGGTAAELITIENVQRALAAYIESQIFVDTAWHRFLDGDYSAISDTAKRGAKLFFLPAEQGGLGCAACHAGDRFTDERFYNVGFPQIGRGFRRADRTDLGRWLVTQLAKDRNAFRTPSLLNVAETAPYGHAGTFQTLGQLLRYHVDPEREIDAFDFSLRHLSQFRSLFVVYDHAEPHTRDALAAESFALAAPLLPRRMLTRSEIDELLSFLVTLTDRCVTDPSCISRWTPAASEDPDGNMLVRNASLSGPSVPAETYPDAFPMLDTATSPLTTFRDVENCPNGLATAGNTGEARFVSTEAVALTERNDYSVDTWFHDAGQYVETTMIGGGVTSAYIDGDCWADLVFTSGETNGMRFYRNVQGSHFEPLDAVLAGSAERELTGTAVADLDGDYRRELVFGNIKPGEVPIYRENGAGQYEKVAALPMSRPTYGISFAPLDASGRLYFYLSHWSPGAGTSIGAPALWKLDGSTIRPWDEEGRTSAGYVDQSFNFTPKFADFTGDRAIDLVIASDFGTSATLRNVPDQAGGFTFVNNTDRLVITDENGMGSTLLDIDNDGVLEWFVTSIVDPTGQPKGNWGLTGNRLYSNRSTDTRMAFEDITDAAGVRHGYWGWGACAADFNNDGFIDIFHVNGFGYIPVDVTLTAAQRALRAGYDDATFNTMQNKPGLLYMNHGDGTFTDQASQWSIDAPSEGRGLTCFDFDRDGDIDVAVFDHSRRPQFFLNMIGSGVGRSFLNVRVVGAPPNTDAIGARLQVTANVGAAGAQTLLRLSEANSNFNSQNVPDLHFGLGTAALADVVRVTWPDGSVLECTNVAANQFIVLDERAGAAACP